MSVTEIHHRSITSSERTVTESKFKRNVIVLNVIRALSLSARESERQILPSIVFKCDTLNDQREK